MGEHPKQFSNKEICSKFRNQRDAVYSEVWLEPYASIYPLPLTHTTAQGIVVRMGLKYIKTDIKKVIFNGETRAILDGPDGWRKNRVAHGQEPHCRFRRQQGGGGIKIGTGIVGDGLIY